jgi:hypothetical protein
MKKYVIQLLLFLTPIILFGFLTDLFVTKTLLKSKQYDFGVWNDLLNGNIHSDLIIQGSSRAWIHIDTKIIEDSLNLSAYNLGVDGHQFFMQLCRHKVLMQHNQKPKIIILSLDYFTLTRSFNLFNKQQFLCYFKDSTILNTIKTYNGFSFWDYNLPFVRYIGETTILLTAIKDYFNPNLIADRYKGYKGNDQNWNNDFNKAIEEIETINVEIDTTTISLFKKYIETTLKEGIKIIFVYSPEFIEGQKFVRNRKEIMTLYTTLSKKYSIPFFDYSNDSISFNQQLFYNSQHLNKKGSQRFTLKLVDDLKKSTILENYKLHN